MLPARQSAILLSVPADRFLLIRLSAVGDVVNTLPTLSLLRGARPDAEIGFVVEDRAADLLRGHPMVDHVHVFPRRRWRSAFGRPGAWARVLGEVASHRAAIRAVGYQTAIDVQGNLKGGVYSVLSGASRRIGFAAGHDRELNHFFSTERVVPPADRPHRVDKFASLLRPLGIEEDRRDWVFPDLSGAETWVREFLTDVGLSPGQAVLVHPGTSAHGAAKRWRPEQYAALGRRIVRDFRRPVVVTWGPGEKALAEAVASAEAQIFVAPPTRSLLELLALLRAGSVLVSADTGPMHLAAAGGLACVSLFGPKDPAIYAPYGRGHTVLYRPGGVDQIDVEEVFAAVGAQLERRSD